VSKALHPLGALNALLTLRTFKRAACYPSHGQAGQQPGVISAAIADPAAPFAVSSYLLM
jgi:hypothetical protein